MVRAVNFFYSTNQVLWGFCRPKTDKICQVSFSGLYLLEMSKKHTKTYTSEMQSNMMLSIEVLF